LEHLDQVDFAQLIESFGIQQVEFGVRLERLLLVQVGKGARADIGEFFDLTQLLALRLQVLFLDLYVFAAFEQRQVIEHDVEHDGLALSLVLVVTGFERILCLAIRRYAAKSVENREPARSRSREAIGRFVDKLEHFLAKVPPIVLACIGVELKVGEEVATRTGDVDGVQVDDVLGAAEGHIVLEGYLNRIVEGDSLHLLAKHRTGDEQAENKEQGLNVT
jgi:hypothetical protein